MNTKYRENLDYLAKYIDSNEQQVPRPPYSESPANASTE